MGHEKQIRNFQGQKMKNWANDIEVSFLTFLLLFLLSFSEVIYGFTWPLESSLG